MTHRREEKAINKTNSEMTDILQKKPTRTLRGWLQIYSETQGITNIFKTKRAIINVLTRNLINGSSRTRKYSV